MAQGWGLPSIPLYVPLSIWEVIQQQEEVSCQLGALSGARRFGDALLWGSDHPYAAHVLWLWQPPLCPLLALAATKAPVPASIRGGPGVMLWGCCESVGALSQGHVAPLVPGLKGTWGGKCCLVAEAPWGYIPAPVLHCAKGSALCTGVVRPA